MPTDPIRAKEIFAAALKFTDPGERSAHLDRECDAEMRVWVDALLAAFERKEGSPPSGPDQTTDFTPTPEAGSTAARQVDDATGAFQSTSEDTDFAHDSSGIGDVIDGKYRIVEVIGEGGMGSVYLAQQNEPVKREVALKLIKTGVNSRNVVARFEAERQALAVMDHPNIARVYDGGTTRTGQPFFVMELVRGVPITRFCDENRVAPKERLELFVQVCRAVQHAHQKGIIHRDLKPGNILVTVVDGRPTPKVIDFGVAKAVDQRLTETAISEEGMIVGTPAYMSPEQADPMAADIDTRTDVYALGVVLYELLAGSPPISPTEFRRRAIAEMLRMVRESEPDHLSTKASSADGLPNIAASRGLEPSQLLNFLRGDVDWIVLKALEKDRERRYESANGMAADILRYLANEPVVARAPSPAYRLRKFVRRNRGPVVASALIAFALVAGVIGIAWQWREAVFQRKQADIARGEAENNFRIAQEQRKVALDAVGQMVTTVRTELLKKPDLQGVLKKVLQIAQGSLDNIAQNPLVDVSLNDTTRAAAHDATARMYRDLGDTPAALTEFNKAADIYQAILSKAADGPEKEVVKKNLLIVLISLGQTSLRTGGQEDARTYYERATLLIATLDNRTATDYRKILISLYTSMGSTTMDKQPRQARENYLGALRIAEELADRELAETGKTSDENRATLSRLYGGMGGVESRLRDIRSAEQYFGKARTIADDMLRGQPGDNGRKHQSANSHERIGDLHLRNKKPADAATEYAIAAPLFKAIADSDPKNVDAQADYSRILYSQGLAAERNGDKPGAAKFFQDSLNVRKNRINLDKETYAQRDLMMSLARSGSHREAVRLAETVRSKLSKDPGALVDITNCYAVCSTIVPATGSDKATHDQFVAKALETLKQAIDSGYGDKVNLETEPDLDGIRDRAEFKEMLNKLPEP